jgi:hypothetical protein
MANPNTYVAGKSGGAISASEFKAQGGVIARLDSDFEFPYKVISYTVGVLGGKYPLYISKPNNGNRWDGAAKDLIENAGPGTAVFFDNIKVVGPDNIVRDLPQMTFNLK